MFTTDNRFTTDIPNKIKQPSVCCLNCGKSYMKKTNLRKHEVTCEFLYPKKSKQKSTLVDEEEELPSYRELFTLVQDLGLKYKTLEKKVEEYEKIAHRQKKKINILDWLNKNQIPDYNYENEMIHTKILITYKHIEYLFNHNYFELIREIYKDNFIKDTYTKDTYTKDIPNTIHPIFGFSEKQNKLYIYTNQHNTSEHTNTAIWVELNKETLIRFNCILQRNISKVFQKWKTENKVEIEQTESLQQICNKTLIKIMTPECKDDKTHNRLKNILYTEIKSEMKDLQEYEIEF